MHHEITLWLLRSTLSTSLALILIGVLRRPLRALFGAEISYRHWLLVPASLLVSLLPSPKLDSEVLVLVGALDAPRAIAQSVVLVSDAGAWWNFAAIVWSLGFAAQLALGAFRYFALAKHVRALSEDTQGISTCSWVQSPEQRIKPIAGE
jgi:beta-lactamase regulating signal transducer with metallopeptidase domain